jgi:hypothetical protein
LVHALRAISRRATPFLSLSLFQVFAMDIVSTIRSIVEIGQQIKKAYEARKEVEGKCGDIYKLIDTMAPVLQAVNAMRLPKNKMQTFVKSLSALAETMKEARTFAMDYLKCSVGSGAAIGLLNLGSQMMSAEDDLKVCERVLLSYNNCHRAEWA